MGILPSRDKKKISKICKRDGRIVDFNQNKITEAIFKALEATESGDRKLASKLSDKVMDKLGKKFHERTIPAVEEIQDLVEGVLVEERLTATVRAYILYREQHKQIREYQAFVDSDKVMQDYLTQADWRVRENANMTFSLQGLNNHVASAVSKHYWLSKIYAPEVREAHNSGDLHIHDLYMLAPYCTGWDLKDLLLRGFGGVSGKVQCKPPKHLRSALGQLVNFFYTLQGEIAGAVAFSNFDTYLAPFIRYDNLDYKQVKQAMQEFLFNMNVPTRVGFQTPFTNLTLDLKVPKIIKNDAVIIGGKPQKATFGEFQAEMDLLNKAFAELMMEGDASGRVFTFPIPTYNITKDFSWGSEVANKIFEMTAKYGTPYFSNFLNSDMSPDDARSMCCRLRLDNRELRKRGGGLFGANPLTGCYDEKTEILTEDGWKFFTNLSKGDGIFTLTENNEIELHKPKKLFEYDYEGEMYQFKTKSLDLLVTPNHRMVVDQMGSGKRKFVEARHFDSNNQRIPKQSIWQGEEREWFILPGIEFTKYGRRGRMSYQVVRDSLKIKIDDWLKFFGFWLAEGCTDNDGIAKRHGYRVIITQVNRKVREEIKKVLDCLPFNYYTERGINFVICNKQLWTYLRQFGNKYEKSIPKEIKSLSKRQLKILFDWMVKGDGYVRKTNGQINYWTVSKILASDLQEIILKLGGLGTLTEQKGKATQIRGREIKAGIVYTLGVQKARHYRLRQRNIKKVYYRGKVYCCEVKNHTVFVRRNGRVSWCGNSIGVVTLNMARLGYLSKNKEEYYERLEKLMRLGRQSLEVKRKVLDKFTDEGLYPYCRVYLSGIKKRFGTYWKNHFNTIGINAMNESTLNFMGRDLTDLEANKFAGEILDFMREKLMDYQIETNDLYNLESTPAEGSSYRFARTDKRKYPDIIVANEEAVRTKQADPFYTNSTHLPVDSTDDIFEVLDLQDNLQTKYTGGTVLHGFIGEKLPDPISTKNLVKKIAENYHLPYYTITPTFSICTAHGYLVGEHFHCPHCGQEAEVYSRVVGYLRPVQQWNKGKQAEFETRKEYKVVGDRVMVNREIKPSTAFDATPSALLLRPGSERVGTSQDGLLRPGK